MIEGLFSWTGKSRIILMRWAIHSLQSILWSKNRASHPFCPTNSFADLYLEIGRNHTALHAASVLGLPTCVKTLLKSGAEPKVKSNIGDTPLDLLEKVVAEPLASHWDPDLNMEHPGLSEYTIQKLFPFISTCLPCVSTERERDLREDAQIEARNDRIPGRMAVAEILRNADQFYRACDWNLFSKSMSEEWWSSPFTTRPSSFRAGHSEDHNEIWNSCYAVINNVDSTGGNNCGHQRILAYIFLGSLGGNVSKYYHPNCHFIP